jgi:Skp family chaperone for outer membrane proteins
MKNRMMVFVLGAAVAAMPAAASPASEATAAADGQSASAVSPLPLPAPVEKELAARAANVTEVTLGKNMLDFAAKFMNGNDKDQAAAKQLIEGLDGIYVRDYEFDKEGQYSMDQIDRLRQAFETPEWSPLVHTRESKGNETTDVMVKLVNGEPHGMFILSAEPKELSIVLILGPIRMDQLGMLKGIGGLGALGNVEKNTKDKYKDKDKPNKGGDQ